MLPTVQLRFLPGRNLPPFSNTTSDLERPRFYHIHLGNSGLSGHAPQNPSTGFQTLLHPLGSCYHSKPLPSVKIVQFPCPYLTNYHKCGDKNNRKDPPRPGAQTCPRVFLAEPRPQTGSPMAAGPGSWEGGPLRPFTSGGCGTARGYKVQSQPLCPPSPLCVVPLPLPPFHQGPVATLGPNHPGGLSVSRSSPSSTAHVPTTDGMEPGRMWSQQVTCVGTESR